MFTTHTARRLGCWPALFAMLVLMLAGCGADVVSTDVVSTDVVSTDVVSTDAPRDLTPADSEPTWTTITVTPRAAVLQPGETRRFAAVATDATGRTEDVSSRAEWTSSDLAVALVVSAGEIRGVAVGTSQIRARFAGVLSGAATLTVAPAMPVALELSPATSTLHAASSETVTLAATGLYADGTRRAVAASMLTWASRAPAVASVNAEGVVTPAGSMTGSVRVTATLGGATTGLATVDVVPSETVGSIAISPTPFTACGNEAVQLHATATYTDGRTEEVTTRVVWTATPDSVATVDAATGIVRGLTPGTATIEASLGDVRGTGMFTVLTSRLVRIEVAPATATVAAGLTTRFAATGHYSCGETRPLTTGISWSSASEAIATVDATGLASGVRVGTTEIVATLGSARSSATLVVSGPVVRWITIAPMDLLLQACGMSQTLSAYAGMSDGTTANVTSLATWSSAMESVVAVSSSGVIRGLAIGGPVPVTATVDGISGTTNVYVHYHLFARVEIAPDPAPSLLVGGTQAFTATGFLAHPSAPRLLTDDPNLRWIVEDASVATISNTAGSHGIVTAVAPGTTTIRAIYTDPCIRTEVTSRPITVTVTTAP